MKEVYFMDTRFEFNIKKVSIKGDDQYLYLYFNNKRRCSRFRDMTKSC